MDSDGSDNYRPIWHKKSNYDMNSKIMLTAIISLSAVVVLVTILQIYARCILRRQARRRAALRRLGFIASSAHHHHVHQHSSTDQQPKRGLDPSIIASLPIFVFDANNVQTGSVVVLECSVCLCMLEGGEMARTLPNCRHTFHAECIDKWFASKSTCPICRTEAEPTPGVAVVLLQPEPREGVIGPTAPPLESSISASTEGTSYAGAAGNGDKIINGSSSSSRLSSFRKILSRDRSSKRIQPFGHEDCSDDLERQ